MVTVRNPVPRLSNELYKSMQSILDSLFAVKDEHTGADVSEPFHNLLPRRQYTDYYKLIKYPQALNPIQNNVKRKTYTAFSGFVKDCAQVFHNAMLYNRHGSQIYSYAEQLEQVLKDQLDRLAEAGDIKKEDAELPDLGPLPPPSPELLPAKAELDDDEISASEPEEEDVSVSEASEGSDDEEDEDLDAKKRRNSGSGRGRRTKRRGSSQPRATRRKTPRDIKEEDAEEETSGKKARDDPRRKRGRPPRVDTPVETRIKNVLKALRKLKDPKGVTRLISFEKLPEKKEFPEYYKEIQKPIALDAIRKTIKRRQYKNLDQFVQDMDVMFNNAKVFNIDSSQIFADAVMLQEELHRAAEHERSRKDEDLVGGEDGASYAKNTRIPVEKIEHKGETYRVGDWIHIVNPNDPNKPTVAQIFRTWKDPDGQIWINACWYYRPEQTVHWVEKRFYENEVVKTGQYRDHNMDEVLGKCFVMFFTKYSRGRPKGVDESKCPIYVCESRYNESDKTMNKIKTWKSCIPDEVRSEDYELVPFEKQRVLKKYESPLKHLLSPDASEDDPQSSWPDAKMGASNAPPVEGAVYKRRREDKDSPPPEPTPPPPPVMPTPPPAPPRQQPPMRTPAAADYHETMSMTQIYKQASAVATPAPVHPPQTPQAMHPHQMRTPMPGPAYPHPHYAASPQTPYAPQAQYGPPQPMVRHPSQQGMYPQHPSIPVPPNLQHQQRHPQQETRPGMPLAVWTADVTAALSPEVKERFQTDSHGNLLLFNSPPLYNRTSSAVGHSAEWLARRAEIKAAQEANIRAKAAEAEELKRKREQEAEEDTKRVRQRLPEVLDAYAKALMESMNGQNA